MLNHWAFIAILATISIIVIGWESDRRLERKQGQIEGLQMQLERTNPNITINQNNRNSGLTGLENNK